MNTKLRIPAIVFGTLAVLIALAAFTPNAPIAGVLAATGVAATAIPAVIIGHLTERAWPAYLLWYVAAAMVAASFLMRALDVI